MGYELVSLTIYRISLGLSKSIFVLNNQTVFSISNLEMIIFLFFSQRHREIFLFYYNVSPSGLIVSIGTDKKKRLPSYDLLRGTT
jgi:hypothetical protein